MLWDILVEGGVVRTLCNNYIIISYFLLQFKHLSYLWLLNRLINNFIKLYKSLPVADFYLKTQLNHYAQKYT